MQIVQIKSDLLEYRSYDFLLCRIYHLCLNPTIAVVKVSCSVVFFDQDFITQGQDTEACNFNNQASTIKASTEFYRAIQYPHLAVRHSVSNHD